MSNILRNKLAIAVLGIAGIALLAVAVGIATVSIAQADTYNFTRSLKMGMSGADVMELQKLLNASADTQVASSGAGSPGNETSYFGSLTKAAVIKWQEKNSADVLAPVGLSSGTGFFGTSSRAKANATVSTTSSTTTTTTTTTTTSSVAGCTSTTGYSPTTGQKCDSTTTTTTVPATTGGALSVGAASQPANGLAPAGAARVPFTKVTFTAGPADVTVSGVTVGRTGAAVDAVFAGIVLLDENGMQLGIAKTLNSNHQATIGDPFVVKAGTSRTLTIAGNMASSLTSYAGQVVAVQVDAVNTGGTVSGSLPIVGAYHTINGTLAIGTATINSSSYDPNTAGSQPIGTTAYRFSGIRFTAGSAEDVTLYSVRWNQTGSVGSGDLSNLVTIVSGTSYPTTVSSDGKYYTSLFGSTGLVITKGNSVDVYLQGDVIGSGASGRTAEFDIYKSTDVYLTGNVYGYGITPTGSFGTISTAATHGSAAQATGTPWFQGSTLSITAGSVTTIGKANEVAAQNIAVNVSGQSLGGYATNFSGEPISVQSTVFTVATTSASLGDNLITSVSIYDGNGAVVAGPVDATWTSAAHSGQTLTFTDTITYQTGRHVYTLKGKLPSTTVNGAQLTVSTTPSSGWTTVTGQTSGNSISLSTLSTAVAMNQMTAKGASLTVAISTQPAGQNVVAGSQDFLFANYQLNAAQSGEDIRLSAFPVVIDVTTSAVTELTGCALWNGSTQLNSGSRIVNTYTDNTAKTFSFDNALTVPKGTIVTLGLKCTVSSAATDAGIFQVRDDQTDGDYSITGITSGNSVTVANGGLTLSTAEGGNMVVATGSFTSAVDSSSPNYSVVAAGSTGVTVGIVKFRASNEAVNLSKLGLTLTSGAAADLGTVYIYNGTTMVGTATFTGAYTTATSTLSSVVALPKDSDKLLTIKADLANIGTGQSGTQGKLIQIDPLNAEGTGVSSGSTLKIGATGNVNGVRAFKSYPTVALDTLQTTGIADGKLMRFKVTANSAGPVGLYNFNFTIATSSFATGGGVSSIYLYGYSDSGYSQAIATAAGSGQIGVINGTTGGTTLTRNPTIDIQATTNAVQVPAGATYYFELKGVVASTQTGTSVSTTMAGDAAYIAAANLGGINVSTTTGAYTDTNNNFIWSGNATTTANITSQNDWTNGYGILGLPSGGITMTRSN
ncbi:MAG: peptidoglycan-binding domain-containing protein [Patescibacteria group bacterium]